MSKEDLALNNQQWLICHKIQPNNLDDLHNQGRTKNVSAKCNYKNEDDDTNLKKFIQ